MKKKTQQKTSNDCLFWDVKARLPLREIGTLKKVRNGNTMSIQERDARLGNLLAPRLARQQRDPVNSRADRSIVGTNKMADVRRAVGAH